MKDGKICTRCGKWKEIEEYSKSTRDGYKSQCKECDNLASKQRYQKNKEKYAQKRKQYYYSNKEKIIEQQKQYVKANEEYYSEYNKQYAQDNSDKLKEYRRQYRKDNIEHIKEYQGMYKKDNAEIIKIKNHKYFQSEKGKANSYRAYMKRRSYKMKVKFSPHQRKDILERDDYTCQCCGIKVHDEKVNNETKAHIDHIIPISRGGDSEPSNLQVLCRTCNLRKGNKLDYNAN